MILGRAHDFPNVGSPRTSGQTPFFTAAPAMAKAPDKRGSFAAVDMAAPLDEAQGMEARSKSHLGEQSLGTSKALQGWQELSLLLPMFVERLVIR